MAHNLMEKDGKVVMVYAHETPWHKLGTVLPDGATIADAIAAAGLDYRVHLSPLYLLDGQIVPMRQAVVRDGGNILGTVGPRYTVAQNTEAFGIAEALQGEGGMTVETAGALGNGEVAWLQMRNHAEIEVRPGDVVRPYLIVKVAHDGSSSIRAIPTAQRVVCQNTLAMVREKSVVSIQHFASVHDRIKEARRILAGFGRAKQEAEANWKAMTAKAMSLDELTAYWTEVFPAPRPTERDELADAAEWLLNTATEKQENEKPDLMAARRDACLWLLENSQASGGKNLWGAYNAVTEYVDHVYPLRQDGSYKTRGAESALFGAGADIRNRAWGAALASIN